jgi:histidine triad (HIT) family protein
LASADEANDYDCFMSNCLFCSIIAGDIPADVVARTEHSLAFRDIDPQAPVHVLVVPLQHSADVSELSADHEATGQLMADAAAVARELGLAPQGDQSGFRLVLNTGAGAGQSVFHTHVHILGGRDFLWPPG